MSFFISVVKKYKNGHNIATNEGKEREKQTYLHSLEFYHSILMDLKKSKFSY
jgi:hypothetical protein